MNALSTTANDRSGNAVAASRPGLSLSASLGWVRGLANVFAPVRNASTDGDLPAAPAGEAAPRTLRVREYRNRTQWEGYQLLQERRWWGWRTIERTEIPPSVLISLATCGDSGGWTSPFYVYGRFGPKGLIQPHAAKPKS